MVFAVDGSDGAEDWLEERLMEKTTLAMLSTSTIIIIARRVRVLIETSFRINLGALRE